MAAGGNVNTINSLKTQISNLRADMNYRAGILAPYSEGLMKSIQADAKAALAELGIALELV